MLFDASLIAGKQVIDLTQERVVSINAAAERLGVSPKTVYVWAASTHEPRLETVKLGGKRVTTLEAIQRFARQDEPTPALVGTTNPSDYERAMAGLRERHGV